METILVINIDFQGKRETVEDYSNSNMDGIIRTELSNDLQQTAQKRHLKARVHIMLGRIRDYPSE
jgi:hypothetical protein